MGAQWQNEKMSQKIDLRVFCPFSKYRHSWVSALDWQGCYTLSVRCHHTQLACQSDTAMPEMERFPLINMPVFLRLGQLTFYVCVWSLLFCNEVLVATQPTTSQPISKLSFPQLPRMCLQYDLPWIYSNQMKKGNGWGGLYFRSTLRSILFSIGMAVSYEIKFWILIFWLPQMICSGDVSISWCWCQVLFMLSCPPGTCKSILYPQLSEEKKSTGH